MKLVNIELNDDERPTKVTVSMTADEAAHLAKHIGKTRPADRDTEQLGWGDTGSEIFDCLTNLFNRFYESGVDGYLRGED